MSVSSLNSSATIASDKQAHADHNEKEKAEVLTKRGEAHAVYRTTLRTELCVFDNSCTSDLPPDYSMGPEFVKDVPHVLNSELMSTSMPWW